MKFNFAKNLLLGSAFAMGAFGLVACGDDGPSKPKQFDQDKMIKVTAVESIVAGSIVKFDANFAPDYIGAGIDPDEADFQIDSLQYAVLNSKGDKINVKPTFTPYTGKRDQISLNELNVGLMLDDPGFKECGTFSLLVNVYAHLDKDPKTSSAKIEFNRDADLFCKEAPTSSSGSQSAGIEMTTYTVKVSTDQLPGLDLASGKASNSTTADIVLSKGKDKGSVIIGSGNGTLFTPISNENDSNYDDDYDTSMWPEDENGRPAVVSDFKYRTITKTQIPDAIEAGSPSQSIYIALTPNGDPATGAGFYAFGISEASNGDANGDFTLTLKVYKKK